jgi:antitoxin component YwqK of YwqJK toxin-antitoxin module
MRKIIFLLAIVVLASCGKKYEERIIETYPDGKPKRVQYFTAVPENSYKAREVVYYQNGKKKMDGAYNADNKKHGKWTYWREDGKVWSEGYFFEGKDDGMRKTWHENGKKHYQGKYDKGTRIGKWKFWDESGKLVKEIDYDKEKE